ncbi:MAG: hypothetical protein QOI49_2458 [Verrucomicrobiota bacterium]|jgi:uncharacterized membrane protein
MTAERGGRLQELAASGFRKVSADSPTPLSTSKRDEEIASGLPENLDALPRLEGFRLRGIEMTRLETFIDAAFAFAVTMMVIAAERVPDNIITLLAAFKNVPAFVAGIAVLGIFWRGHWKWSRRYGLEDGISIFISWVLLVTILIYIYPLKALFGSMFYLLSDGRLGQTLGMRSITQVRAILAIYATGFAAIAFEIVLLNLRAWQLREPLRLNERERFLTRAEMMGWSMPATVGIIALVLAFTLPAEQLGWSGWIYFSLVVLVPLHKRFLRRRRPA